MGKGMDMKIKEKDVVSVVKSSHQGITPWVYMSTQDDLFYDPEFEGIDGGVVDLEMCYTFWLRVTGIKLTVRKPVRVRISAEIVPTPDGA